MPAGFDETGGVQNISRPEAARASERPGICVRPVHGKRGLRGLKNYGKIPKDAADKAHGWQSDEAAGTEHGWHRR